MVREAQEEFNHGPSDKDSGVPRGGSRHALSACHQGDAEGELTVVDRPVIQLAVDEAREAGIEHFVFVTGRGKAVIEDHFDKQFELRGDTQGARQDGRAGRAGP